jgi:hypothetical protein
MLPLQSIPGGTELLIVILIGLLLIGFVFFIFKALQSAKAFNEGQKQA